MVKNPRYENKSVSDKFRLSPVPNFYDRKLILLTGGGGVGKTTVSASLALGLALRGKKVLVLTVDPARRLADAMCVKEIGNVATEVDLSLFENRHPQGRLFAMMLDAKRGADQLVLRFASSKEKAEKILNNSIYKTVSNSLAGTQEYVAFATVYDLLNEEYDTLVVDTAPTRYALEFLEGPTRLVDLLDARIIRWFMMPLEKIQRYSYKIFKKGAELLFSKLETTIGISIITEVLSFISLFDDMVAGIRERAQRLDRMLKDRLISLFLCVCVPTHSSLEDTFLLFNKLKNLGFPVEQVIINRIHLDFLKKEELHKAVSYELEKLDKILLENVDEPLLNLYRSLLYALEKSSEIVKEEQSLIQKFKAKIGLNSNLIEIPFFEQDIYSLQGLYRLSEYLFTSI